MSTALPVRRAPDATAILLMIGLCAVWGFQQVAIKGANVSFPPLLQAGIRSTIATVLVWFWTRSRGVALFRRDNTLASGLLAGVLFGGEFVCIFLGLTLTSATRMVVFLYTAPCFMALGLHFFVPGEKLRRVQWVGIGLAFGGIAIAFADGFLHPDPETSSTWQGTAGDALGVLGGVFWAATTVVIRASPLARASASKTLLYQLGVSAIILLALAFALDQTHIGAITPTAIASLAYQAVIVAFLSYLTWFWLLTRYMASRLSVFSFLTPIFGVAFGVAMLGDTLTTRFVVAAGLVIIGIGLVNAPVARARV